jgi:TonB family protein
MSHPNDRRTPAAAPPGGLPADPVTEGLDTFLREDDGDRRRLRAAVAAALVFHALLLLVPTLRSEAVAVVEPPAKQLLVIQPVRFKPPEPEPEDPPEKEAVKVQIPDPTPLDPEPLRPIEDIALAEADHRWGDYVIEVPQAPPEPDPEPVGPIPVGGDVARPQGIYTPRPEYTEIARKTRTQGRVTLQVILDKEGRVGDLKVLAALPMGLTERAVEAVRTWRYEPATLDGRPVEVYMTITITFTLQ